MSKKLTLDDPIIAIVNGRHYKTDAEYFFSSQARRTYCPKGIYLYDSVGGCISYNGKPSLDQQDEVGIQKRIDEIMVASLAAMQDHETDFSSTWRNQTSGQLEAHHIHQMTLTMSNKADSFADVFPVVERAFFENYLKHGSIRRTPGFEKLKESEGWYEGALGPNGKQLPMFAVAISPDVQYKSESRCVSVFYQTQGLGGYEDKKKFICCLRTAFLNEIRRACVYSQIDEQVPEPTSFDEQSLGTINHEPPMDCQDRHMVPRSCFDPFEIMTYKTKCKQLVGQDWRTYLTLYKVFPSYPVVEKFELDAVDGVVEKTIYQNHGQNVVISLSDLRLGESAHEKEQSRKYFSVGREFNKYINWGSTRVQVRQVEPARCDMCESIPDECLCPTSWD